MPDTPILLCRTAWMHDYQGLEPGIHSNAKYIREHGYGDEIYNFLGGPTGVYGFVQVNGHLNIRRLGAARGDESVKPVTVIWTAPRKGGGVYVVGWYRRATVYRSHQDSPNNRARKGGGRKARLCTWVIRARSNELHLIPQDDRWFTIPDRYVTQSLIAYLDGGSAAEERLKGELRQLVGGNLHPPKPTSGTPKQPDHAKLLRVERNACETVRQHFEAKGYSVSSVEQDHVGWDLEARLGALVLRIEVKGCSGDDVIAELTPNEYRQSHAKAHRDVYRICVVTRALSDRRLHVFGWNVDVAAWTDERNQRLQIDERIAAQIRLR